MKEAVLQLFASHPEWAVLLSMALSIVIAVAGIIPSFFVTAANVLFFGFWPGTALSFAGEAIGAFVAFLLYRKGFKKKAGIALSRFPKAKQLTESKGKAAFSSIVMLRLLPLVPSGLVSLAAAVSSVSTPVFFIASSVGKLPALLLEAYSVQQVTRFTWQGKIILGMVAAALLYYIFFKPSSDKNL